ncbi:unnamed protein product [Cuscuta campestris]|uniref:Major pollen allergen Ole e 6-like n=2 Tax=Cuscuta sect. Cleistogrammica TaxID=1824901 RepID=A0A484M5B5_9ASTE|nr:hypothetical protein DM860_015545 [Cuscuta australis]VFQ83769.1 unnamed protein product [Cuscuta campestris]VFQ83881.1 unnamed protein product [Cuscuta campestris]
MASTQKLVAILVLCVLVLSAVHLDKAEGASEVYKQCFDKCQNDCMKEGRGYTDCEMKCDTECSAIERKANLQSLEG